MKRKILAGLVVTGVLGISGAAFAGVNVNINIDRLPKVAAKTQQRELPPKVKPGKKPDMPQISRDNRMPPPPGAHSPDKRPPNFDGKKPPMNSKNNNSKKDNRMPPPPGAHSPDKRPPEFRK